MTTVLHRLPGEKLKRKSAPVRWDARSKRSPAPEGQRLPRGQTGAGAAQTRWPSPGCQFEKTKKLIKFIDHDSFLAESWTLRPGA
jgi:hypothetical protein